MNEYRLKYILNGKEAQMTVWASCLDSAKHTVLTMNGKNAPAPRIIEALIVRLEPAK